MLKYPVLNQNQHDGYNGLTDSVLGDGYNGPKGNQHNGYNGPSANAPTLTNTDSALSPSPFKVPSVWAQFKIALLEMFPLASVTFGVYQTQTRALVAYQETVDPTVLELLGVFIPPLLMMLFTGSLGTTIFVKRAAYYWLLENASVVVSFESKSYWGSEFFRWNFFSFLVCCATMFRCYPNLIHDPTYTGWQNFFLLIFSYAAFFTLSMDFWSFEQKLITINESARVGFPSLTLVTEDEARCCFLEIVALAPSKKQDKAAYKAYKVSPETLRNEFGHFLQKCRCEVDHEHRWYLPKDSESSGRYFGKGPSCLTACLTGMLFCSCKYKAIVAVPSFATYGKRISKFSICLMLLLGFGTIAIELYGGYTLIQGEASGNSTGF